MPPTHSTDPLLRILPDELPPSAKYIYVTLHRADEDALTPAELTDRTIYARSTVSVAIHSLEDWGLVERESLGGQGNPYVVRPAAGGAE